MKRDDGEREVANNVLKASIPTDFRRRLARAACPAPPDIILPKGLDVARLAPLDHSARLLAPVHANLARRGSILVLEAQLALLVHAQKLPWGANASLTTRTVCSGSLSCQLKNKAPRTRFLLLSPATILEDAS